jgi:protease-4
MKSVLKWLLIASLAMLALSLLVAVIALLVSGRIPKGSILHVELSGEVRESPESDVWTMFAEERTLTLSTITDSIRRAADDERIAGLILEVKDPKLGFAQLQEVEKAMEVFRRAGKWNLSYLETAGEFDRGSALFALAACADTIVLSPPGDINLVGLGTRVPFARGMLDRLRIGVHMAQRYEYKNAADVFTRTEMSPAHREATKALVDDLQALLLAHIAERRHVDAAQAERLLATGPHLGQEALALGLVDKLAYWDEVEKQARETSGKDEPFVRLAHYAATGDLHHSGKTVALIYGEGNVARGESSPGQVMGSDTVTEAFRRARQEKVAGVLFRVDSPGGSYIASDLIRREVQITRDAGIPVVVSMGNLAASGGYFVSMDANRIVADSGTITGSIGVFAGTFSLREFWSHWTGITFDSYLASPNADFFSWLDKPGEQKAQVIERFVDRIYDDFVSKVAEGRGIDRAEVEKIARGRVWSGSAAKAHGLVDVLGDTEVALAELKKLIEVAEDGDVDLKVFPKPKTPFEALGEALSQTSGAAHLLHQASAWVHSRAGMLRIPDGWQVP